MTPWIIKASGLSPGRYTLTFDPPKGGSIANLRVRSLNGSTWSSSNVATLTSSNDTAYFYLEGIRATDVTFTGSTEVTVAAKLTGSGLNSTKSFKVRKPPVVLVHGVNAKAETWQPAFLGPIQSVRQPAQIGTTVPFVIPITYFNATVGRLDDLSLSLDTRLRTEIESRDQALRKNWAFTRYDVVGHSQGGVLLRMLCQNAPGLGSAGAFAPTKFVSEANFNRGRFRRIITIGSPHNGSYLIHYIDRLNTLLRAKGYNLIRGLPLALQLFNLTQKFDPFREQIEQINDTDRPVDAGAKFHLIGSTIGGAKVYKSLALEGAGGETTLRSM